MAYRLKATESVPDGIRRIVREEVEDATKQLANGRGDQRDGAIHEARKSIKKIRGALRLMQPELGRGYKRENDRLREVGHHLSEVRDAQAIIEVFDGIVDKYKGELTPECVRAVRRGLLKNKQETEARLDVEKIVREAVTALRAVGRDVNRWPLEADGFEAIAPGFKRRYKRGQAAMAKASKQPSADTYHNFRKRVKDHWYHVRLVESLWTEMMRAREAALKDLETWLGDDHNLVVLKERLESAPDQYGGERNVQVFAALMDKYSEELREKAMSLGERLYEQKPKALVRDLKKLWNDWQDQPPGMKGEQRRQRAGRKPARKQPGTESGAKKAAATA